LHGALKRVLPAKGVADDYLGDDPCRTVSGPVYVQSDPGGGNNREIGLDRLNKDLVPRGRTATRVAHVALVYCNSEDWQHLHLASAADAGARALFAGGRYLSIRTSPAWLVRVIAGLRFAQPQTPSLARRNDFKSSTSGGSSGLVDVLRGLINDTCVYVCENDLRSRVRGFVWQALTRLALRPDVGAVVVNAHSQGTVIALDALAGMEKDVSDKVKVLVTAGSHLRKMVDLFAWGNRINRDDKDLPWLPRWHNYWDPADPVADPLRPGPKWKAGAKPDVPQGAETLYQSLDPAGGDAHDVVVWDCSVDNTKFSRGSGLRAHNYWDNVEQFVPRLADLLIDVSESVQPSIVSSGAGSLVGVGTREGGVKMNNENQRIPVRFPAEARQDDGTDLSPPIVQLLQDIHVLAPGKALQSADGAQAVFNGPPQSVAIIEAGATALGKWWATTLGAGAGLTGIVAAVKGIWGNEPEPVRVALVAGAAIVLSALSVAIAVIVNGDVRGRAAGSVAEYQARAQVATAFLGASAGGSKSAAVQATDGYLVSTGIQGRYEGKLKGSPVYEAVTGFRVALDGPSEIKVGNAWLPVHLVELRSSAVGAGAVPR
jgi:hypothetical protein